MSRQLKLAAAAAVAALSAAPAFAVSTASATLGPFQIDFRYLDQGPFNPGNPSITFRNDELDVPYVSTDVFDTFSARSSSDHALGSGPFDLLSVAASVPTASGRADVTGIGQAQGTSLNASGTAIGVFAPGGTSHYSNFSSVARTSLRPLPFMLSPRTMVIITVPMALRAQLTNSSGPGGTNVGESAWASAYISIEGPGGSPEMPGTQSYSQQVILDAATQSFLFEDCVDQRCVVDENWSNSGVLGVAFVNETYSEIRGNFTASVTATGRSYANVAPVPEPSTYAIMLAGLAAVGFVTRRRG